MRGYAQCNVPRQYAGGSRLQHFDDEVCERAMPTVVAVAPYYSGCVWPQTALEDTDGSVQAGKDPAGRCHLGVQHCTAFLELLKVAGEGGTLDQEPLEFRRGG